ncbi:MAG: fimbrillin family protein [Bacteroidales bacterium]|nr:fimbrillin family protein [Bacteroidales bacterium]
MKTRHAYLTVVAAAFLLSACTISEITSSKISFAPVASKATRAIITGTVYPETEHFVVSAFHDGAAPYFERLEASYNSTIALWATSTDQYWPLGGSLTFKAYSPASATGLSIDQTNGVTATDYTVQSTTEMTTDLCYATATVADCSTHPESVPLTFSHALSQVVFRVKAADYYNNANSTVNLSLKGLSLNNIYTVGDFADGTWSNQESLHDFTFLSNASLALTYNAQNEPDIDTVCTYLFLPQTLSSAVDATASLTVSYSIAQTLNSATFTFENAPVTIPLRGTITQWEPGKKYIYTLSIGLNDNITFTATTDVWTAAEAGVTVE